MSRQARSLWVLGICGLAATGSFPGGLRIRAGEQEPSASAPARVVIPFDFESKFDNGRYGRMIGDLLWKKLDRAGGYILPESMLDVREWSERRGVTPSHGTSLDKMREFVQRDFHAQIGVWGSIERVAGSALDEYDLWIHIVDFSNAEPKVIFFGQSRTKTVSEIPHLSIQQALDKLYGRQPSVVAPPDPDVERRWGTGKNLVIGDFESGTSRPAGWDALPPNVCRVAVTGTDQRTTQVIRFQFGEDVAGTTGVLYYSDYFPVEEGAMYRFQCRWRTTGSAAKVFIKCYDELPTEFREGMQGTSSQRREVYRSQQNLTGPAKSWNVHREEFMPRHTQFSPRWGRVMLYAYWPAGTVDWDDIVVKQIAPAVDGQESKVRRPSLETKVLSGELERK